MHKKFIVCLLLIACTTIIAVAMQYYLGLIRTATPIAAEPAGPPRLTIALVPLDSRPPCTLFVKQLAELAGMRVLLPPPELLDNYEKPADKYAVRAWLREVAPQADAVIISSDMLVHGGLIASRLGLGTAADGQDVLALIRDLHQDYPRLRLYAFNVIPRLLIADSDSGAVYQQKLLSYSILKDEIAMFENPADIAAAAKLEQEIPPEIIARYRKLYDVDLAYGLQLADLVEQGVLTGLVIGQDDGQPFGLPNMVKQRTEHLVNQRPALAGRVFVTRGTDEVALTLVGHIATEVTGYQAKICVRYSNADTAGRVMPFMPHSVEHTVQEKIQLVGGRLVASPDQADFTLFIHTGTSKTTPGELEAAARTVKALLHDGRRVAIVDLSEDYYGHETLLPYLFKEQVDLTKLAAYAGWNSTSNAIGSAITQASIYTQSLRGTATGEPDLALYQRQLEFLAARFLDDWYFQKDVQALVNEQLHTQGIDPYHLGASYAMAEAEIGRMLKDRADSLLKKGLSGHPTVVQDSRGRYQVAVTGLKLATSLPWARTFEVRVEPALSFARLAD